MYFPSGLVCLRCFFRSLNFPCKSVSSNAVDFLFVLFSMHCYYISISPAMTRGGKINSERFGQTRPTYVPANRGGPAATEADEGAALVAESARVR